jgi:hypothetical protein
MYLLSSRKEKCIMKWTRWSVRIMAGIGLLLMNLGCGGQQPPPSPEGQADAKVAAIKRLAEAMAQEPDGPEARGALEDFRNTPLDVEKNPNQAAEIVEVYRQRIQGKYKGLVAQEIQGEMGYLQVRSKKK